MQKNSGFTAFELAISLAIVAIMATLVLPPYLQWQRGHRLRGAVNNLMGDLEMAKVRAIRENAFVVVRFDQNRYTIFMDNGQPGGVAGDWDPSGELIVKSKILPAGVQFDLADLEFVEVTALSSDDITRFDGRGLPDRINTETEIPLMNQSDNRSIFINRLGRLRVQ